MHKLLRSKAPKTQQAERLQACKKTKWIYLSPLKEISHVRFRNNIACLGSFAKITNSVQKKQGIISQPTVRNYRLTHRYISISLMYFYIIDVFLTLLVDLHARSYSIAYLGPFAKISNPV